MNGEYNNKGDFFATKGDDFMAVLAKTSNIAFEVSAEKSEAFEKKDTKPAFAEAMKKFEKHGGKTTKRT